jgi:hypothetical protein
MKSDILTMAINRRSKVRFLYRMEEVIFDPYFILYEEDGSKAIYGKADTLQQLKKFDFRRIVNLKMLPLEHFNPDVPVRPAYN